MAITISLQLIREQRLAAEQEIRKAEARVEQARRHLSDLEGAERVLTRLQSGSSSITSVSKALDHFETPMGSNDFSARNPFRHKTNKAYIWEVLDRSSNPWMNANQIQEAASALKGDSIPMVSVSPMLSDMKGEYLERDNLLVALKTRLHENGAEGGNPSTAPETALAAQ
jgi:DNA mismatch repair ATPase MutS